MGIKFCLHIFESVLFLRLRIQEHPDKGGDPEKFKQISKAYEILSNPETRGVYDLHGEKAADTSGSGGGGMSSSRGQPAVQRGENVVQRLPVQLRDLYLGKVRVAFP